MRRMLRAILQQRSLRLAVWYLLAGASVLITYAAGPFIQFPIAFVFPVALAAWFDGLGHALGLAIALPLVRLGFVLGIWTVPWTDAHSIANAVVRISVLSLVAALTTRVGEQHRALGQKVAMLERILPICSYCKKIRTEDESWQALETYLHAHTDIALSHGLCPDCARQHYGEFLGDE
jgi:hypothetical protein